VLSEYRSIFPPVSDPQVLYQFDGLLHRKLHQGKMPESDEMSDEGYETFLMDLEDYKSELEERE